MELVALNAAKEAAKQVMAVRLTSVKEGYVVILNMNGSRWPSLHKVVA